MRSDISETCCSTVLFDTFPGFLRRAWRRARSGGDATTAGMTAYRHHVRKRDGGAGALMPVLDIGEWDGAVSGGCFPALVACGSAGVRA